MKNDGQMEMQFNERNEAVLPVEGVEAPESAYAGTETEIVAEIHIRRLADGRLDVYIPEQYRQLNPNDVEITTRQVYEELRDLRVASSAIEMFKKRLG